MPAERRARSLSEVVGPHPLPKRFERDLRIALSDKDPEKIADAIASVVRWAFDPRDFQAHLARFLPFIRQQLRAREPPDDLRRAVRDEWARLKKKHGIEIHGVPSEAVVQGVLDFLRAHRE